MRKKLDLTEGIFPMPVLMVATYNPDGSVDVMNAAWGTMQERGVVALNLTETHKTVQNIKARGAFTVSIADAAHVVEADYFGVVSAKNEPRKFERSGLTAERSDLIDAPGELANPPQPDRTLAEGDVLDVGTARFRVVETPGHTPGGIILVGEGSAEGIAFVGDTLFAGSCGRCDLLGGSWDAMSRTLERLAGLIAPEVTLLCGHGPTTTMGIELKTNPYLQRGAWRPSHGEA